MLKSPKRKTDFCSYDMDTVINVVPNPDIFRYSQFSIEYGRMSKWMSI